MSYEDRTYDVAIMGGGPAGASLAALLARRGLSVAVFEKEFFPREHIGESLGHRTIPVLEESGALAKVLASECWVRKPGGYYAWDPRKPPFATVFDAEAAAADGVPRWAFHVNRSEFDEILLRNAADCGADVFEGISVSNVRCERDVTYVELGEAGVATARYFVEASGRTTALTTKSTKTHLSRYRNIAIWNHLVGGKAAHSIPGVWNIYGDRSDPPIGNFTFDDGWFWYIPVRKMVMGKRTNTHSLGMVTDPRVLRDPAKRYTDMRYFMERARSVPLLKDLIADAEPVSDKVLTATNYSMISERFCNFDERWMLLGDAAYFVDPLFSSGVSFALGQAAAAAVVIEYTLNQRLPALLLRELWDDYEEGWQGLARTFALAIDQWYHAIALASPNSVYWQFRAEEQLFDPVARPFQVLVDNGVSPNMLRVMTRGSITVDALGNTGPFVEALTRARTLPTPDARIVLAGNVQIKDSVALETSRAKGVQSAGTTFGDPAGALYWSDPLKHASEVPPLHPPPRACCRLYFSDGSRTTQVRFDDHVHRGRELVQRLSGGPIPHNELRESLTAEQRQLLDRMFVAGMVVEAS